MPKPYALPATNYIIASNAYTEAKIKHRLTERDHTVLLVLERRGWGWGVATVALDVAQLAAEIGLWPKQVDETIAKLLEHGVLYRDGEEIGIQTDVTRWTMPLRKSRDRKRSFEKASETANDHLISANDHLQNRKRSFAETVPESANGAASASPKETTKESIKDNPPTPQGVEDGPKFYGLAAIASEAEWADGEQARFLKLVNLSKMKDLGLLVGKTAEQVKVYLAFSPEYRATGWAYLEDRKASEPTIPPPPKGYGLFTLVDYLQDPSKYPAVARKQASMTEEDKAKAQPAPDNPWKDKPYWQMFDPRFVDTIRPGPEGQMSYIFATIGNRYGREICGQIMHMSRSKGLDAAMTRIVPLWFNQGPATQGAANG